MIWGTKSSILAKLEIVRNKKIEQIQSKIEQFIGVTTLHQEVGLFTGPVHHLGLGGVRSTLSRHYGDRISWGLGSLRMFLQPRGRDVWGMVISLQEKERLGRARSRCSSSPWILWSDRSNRLIPCHF